MENKNLKLLDAIDKKDNVYRVIIEIAKRTHDLIKGGIPSVEVKKDENVVGISIKEFLQRLKIINE
ncbi:MAG: DNA-directed RNA polymerase subunit omega [Candidatus Omnitrophica bacterium]|nr:DNA-directed RNA polymerase subunit omega [Candidatus Omnitrophota bacterium]